LTALRGGASECGWISRSPDERGLRAAGPRQGLVPTPQRGARVPVTTPSSINPAFNRRHAPGRLNR
jgi:hypothetical protein